MSKQFWAVILVVVLIFVGIFALTGHKSNDSKSSSSSASKPTEHVMGKGESGVTLLEYGDYQCPYCEDYSQPVKEVVAKYQDQIRFQFRNFPLVNAHPNAFAAARAAEAAGKQGKFWEMHDALYESSNWQQWTVASNPTPLFDQYATQLGLDVTKFKSDYGSSAVNNLINADQAAGTKAGVTGTPTFFLNGKQIQVANNVDAFSKVIDAEIAKQKQ